MSPAPAAARQADALAAVDKVLTLLRQEMGRRTTRGEDGWPISLMEATADMVRALVVAYPPAP